MIALDFVVLGLVYAESVRSGCHLNFGWKNAQIVDLVKRLADRKLRPGCGSDFHLFTDE
jgi:hypothetical protein